MDTITLLWAVGLAIVFVGLSLIHSDRTLAGHEEGQLGDRATLH